MTVPSFADPAGGDSSADGAMAAVDAEAGDLPESVAAAPQPKPGTADIPAVAVASESSGSETAETSTDAPAKTAATSPSGQVLETGGPILTAGTLAPAPIEPRKKAFLSSFFATSSAAAAPAESPAPKVEKTKPLIDLAETKESKPVRLASLGSGDALPGVRGSNSLFEIKRKNGMDDDSDIDVHEDEEAPVRLASAAGLARLAPNGLLKQRDSVDIGCLKPDLVRMLKQVERHFGKKLIVTSGYRSPTYNRKVNGAKRSQHMYCAAADVQIPGVSKWELASYARALPGRGGVGTYCHTSSVHIDIGPERDWNWKCRRG